MPLKEQHGAWPHRPVHPDVATLAAYMPPNVPPRASHTQERQARTTQAQQPLKADESYTTVASSQRSTRHRHVEGLSYERNHQRSVPRPPRHAPRETLDQEQHPRVNRRRFLGFSLLGAGVGLAAMLAGRPVVEQYEETQAWPYHDARVSQLDADIGLGGVTHLFSFYRQGQVIILAFPQNFDPSHLKVLCLPILSNTLQANTARTVVIQPAPQGGKQALAVHVEGMTTTLLVMAEQFK